MMLSRLILIALFQAPVTPAVIVALNDGQKLLVENPEFSGFIESRNGEPVLMYRQENFHGEITLSAISRIEFREYRRGRPFALSLTLRNGQKLEVQSERRNFVSVKGRTEFGNVTINHPDPPSSSLRPSTSKPNRKNDLTIQYLEFPGS